ncbi:MAG TPA: hypothetical protein PK691_02255 [Thermomicrobiales bacterium]|nr:hypothetical protein [Thermomicrobiales bacterium]
MRTGQVLRKAAVLSTLIAIMVTMAWQPAAARERGGAGGAGANGDTFAAMCRAAGGTPVWTTSIDSGGYVTYIVECKGGYLGGLNCIFDEQFTSCTQTRRLPDVVLVPIEVVEIAPVDESAPPQVIATVSVNPEVVTDEATIEPTSTPTAEEVVDTGTTVITDPVVIDQPATDPTATATPTTDPEVDGGSTVITDPVVVDVHDLHELVPVKQVPDLLPAAPIEIITFE